MQQTTKMAVCIHGQLGIVDGTKLVGRKTKDPHIVHYGRKLDGSLWRSKDARFLNNDAVTMILRLLGPGAFTKGYQAA